MTFSRHRDVANAAELDPGIVVCVVLPGIVVVVGAVRSSEPVQKATSE